MAGFDFDDLSVDGLISAAPLGSWENPNQQNSAFGVSGVSVIDGGLRKRDFGIEIMVWGWTSQAARDAAIMSFEEYVGTVSGLFASTPFEPILSFPSNIRMAAIRWGKPGYDARHLYYRQLFFDFEQLAPPKPPKEDVSSSSSSS